MPKSQSGTPQSDRQLTRLYYGFGVTSAKRIKVCPACGEVGSADKNFCTKCGEKLPSKNLYEQSIEGKKRCTHCGSLLGEAKNFCPICGRSLTTAEPAEDSYYNKTKLEDLR